MKMIPVESSMICAVGYDAKTHELQVVFNSGRTYRYQNVEREVFQELLQAKSKGSYVNAHIIGVYDVYSAAKKVT